MRGDYGVQSDAESWGDTILSRRSDWDRRPGTYGTAVCEGVWSGGHRVLYLKGQRDRGEVAGGTSLCKYAGHGCLEEGGRIVRFPTEHGECRPRLAGLYECAAAEGNALCGRSFTVDDTDKCGFADHWAAG